MFSQVCKESLLVSMHAFCFLCSVSSHFSNVVSRRSQSVFTDKRLCKTGEVKGEELMEVNITEFVIKVAAIYENDSAFRFHNLRSIAKSQQKILQTPYGLAG